MFFQDLKSRYRYSGWQGALTYVGYRLANQLFYFDCLRLMTLELNDIDPEYLGDPDGFESRFLSHEELDRFSKDEKYQLTSELLASSLEKGDYCYAFIKDEQLASYGWYAIDPTKVTGEFEINFPNSWVYMHHGYTNPDFRGQRLHAFGMAKALKHFSDQGFRGLISIVASENASSLKSTRRLGYREIGKFFLFSRFNRYFVFSTRGTRKEGAFLTPYREEISAYFLLNAQKKQNGNGLAI